jgi:hypothetical protein
MTNTHEKQINRAAAAKGYRLEKVGKGPHHGRFAILKIAEGSRMNSGVRGAEYSFSPAEAEAWLASH